MAKYHPHGDSSVYDAMVRLAQGFNMRRPLVDGQGNFGSIDGDGAAAMRYTEARLMPLALELLRDLDCETVPFSRNYDDKLLEPDMLPGRFPNLLVNGSTGIAVGLATNIPPHNLSEVIDGVIAYIDNRNIKLKDLIKIVKGPDFPTGGFVIAEDINRIYETGKGRLIMRAKVHIETAANDKKNIVITELPYQVNKADLLTKILALKENKKELLAGISDITDESDKDGMRAVITIKKDYDPKQILKVLFKYSNLQCNFGVNIVAIADGKPQQMGLLDIIAYYTDYQKRIITNRTKFQLKKAKERAHILEGLIIAVANIDEVVKIIKTSSSVSDARSNLRSRFGISEIQADAILELKLARLTKLEVTKLQKELAEVKDQIVELNKILNSKQTLNEVLKSELTAIKRVYRDERRTTIVTNTEDINIPCETDEKPIENYVIGLTGEKTVKCIPAKNFNLSIKDASEKTTASSLHIDFTAALSTSKVLIMTDKGNCYQTTADKFTETKFRDNGIPLENIFAEASGETPVAIFTYNDQLPKGKLLFYTKNGMVKLTDWSEYGLLKTSFNAAKIREDDELINVEELLTDSTILFISKQGMCLNISYADVPEQGRVSGGVKGMMLNEGDNIVFAGQINPEGEVIVITDKGFLKRVLASEFDTMTRYRKGVKITSLGDNGKKVLWGGYVTEPYDIALMDAASTLIVNTEEINIESRTSKGKPHKTRKKGMSLVSVYPVKTSL